MSNLKLIIGREYNTRVRKKSFLVTTILIPIIFVGFAFAAMYLSHEDSSQSKVLIADPGGWCDGKIFQEDTVDAPARFFFYENYIDSASTFLTEKKFEDYDVLVSLNEKIVENRRVPVYYKKLPNLETKKYIQNRIEARIRKYLALKKTRLTETEYDLIQLPFSFKYLDAEDPSNLDLSTERSLIGFAFSVITFIFIFVYSAQVMRGVIEEKTNRVVEIIISSIKPFQLMMGKIIGIGLVGLTQFIIWVVVSGVGLTLLRMFAFPDMTDPSNWDAIAMENGVISSGGLSGSETWIYLIYEGIQWPIMIGAFLIYFVGGFLIYSSLFAMIGAMVDSETDTQQLILPVIMPLMLSYMVSAMMLSNPESTIATWFSIIPFTSPVVMMVKAAVGTLTPWHYIPSIILLFLTFIGTTWVAAKIYRTGILMYGKKASWKEVFKWIRYK